tara:strand:- start:893 stop:1462 length:570 start_codon:yes stop_codon:yes gene_type:complete
MVSKKNNTKKSSCVYDSNDFNDKNGMLTAIWGPGMWHFLHTMSFNYPNQPSKMQKKQYKDFILSLKHVLPCGKCRENLAANFKIMPLKAKHMKNRENFSKYVYDLHELVNKQLNKTSGLTYEVVRERYEHFRARCVFPNKNKTKKKSDKGCVVPLYGEKAKCVLHIVPQDKKCKTLQIDEKCIKKKIDI